MYKAMSWKITVLTPNGRRHTKSYSPNDTLLNVLDETCKKYEFKSEEFDLTHHNRIIDTNLILRFSGLPNNAFLEMAPIQRIRKESDVIICLQVENGNRFDGTFTPSTSLYEIVTKLIPEEISPTLHVIYMRREINGTQLLTETSLKSLGLTSGRAILRLIHRTPEQIKVQAHVSTPLPHKPKDDEIFEEVTGHTVNTKESRISSVNVDVLRSIKAESKNDETQEEIEISMIKEESNENIEIKHNIISETEVKCNDEDMEVTNTDQRKEQSYLNEIITLGERNAIAFSQEMIEDVPFIDVPDNFYNLTVDEVKKLFLQLRKKREELENAPLLTSSLRTSDVLSKIDKYKSALIRVLFPDRIVLQGTFLPLDTIKTVKNFVKLYLQDNQEEFDLYLSPPKQILVDDVTLYDANCIPTAILHFGPHERHANTMSLKSHYLKPEIFLKLTPPKAALLSANLFK